ncbi:MAG TPA: universal stress protein [Thermomicrobiaceae bacterium]|nr:universal stress protein [Thermomicrobiaceae bacterium]
MIGTVVVPLDGSSLAEAAIPLAQVIAERSGAMLQLLQVVPSDASAAVQEQAREYLRAQARRIDDRVQISIHLGDPAGEIVDGAAELLDPIVVMTTHGRSGLRRWAFGSVAERVIHGARTPVLLIRSGTAPPPAIRAILLPLDGSAYAEAALPYAAELTRAFDAVLHVARVVEMSELSASRSPEVDEAMAMVVDGLARGARDYVDRCVAGLRERGLRAEPHLLEGDAAEELIALERAGVTDLTVMATRARAVLSRVVFGSVAEKLLKLGTTPLMLVEPELVPNGAVPGTSASGIATTDG